MSKVLVYPTAGGVAIVSPVRQNVVALDDDGAPIVRPETDDEMIARCRDRLARDAADDKAPHVPADAPETVQVVDGAALPADRSLRAAWRMDKGVVGEDRTAAVAFAEAKGATVEAGDDLDAIKAKLAALR